MYEGRAQREEEERLAQEQQAEEEAARRAEDTALLGDGAEGAEQTAPGGTDGSETNDVFAGESSAGAGEQDWPAAEAGTTQRTARHGRRTTKWARSASGSSPRS